MISEYLGNNKIHKISEHLEVTKPQDFSLYSKEDLKYVCKNSGLKESFAEDIEAVLEYKFNVHLSEVCYIDKTSRKSYNAIDKSYSKNKKKTTTRKSRSPLAPLYEVIDAGHYVQVNGHIVGIPRDGALNKKQMIKLYTLHSRGMKLKELAQEFNSKPLTIRWYLEKANLVKPRKQRERKYHKAGGAAPVSDFRKLLQEYRDTKE